MLIVVITIVPVMMPVLVVVMVPITVVALAPAVPPVAALFLIPTAVVVDDLRFTVDHARRVIDRTLVVDRRWRIVRLCGVSLDRWRGEQAVQIDTQEDVRVSGCR
jgi:hypothetical protein